VTPSKETHQEPLVEIKNWHVGIFDCRNIFRNASEYLCVCSLNHETNSKHKGSYCGCVIGDLLTLRKSIRDQKKIMVFILK